MIVVLCEGYYWLGLMAEGRRRGQRDMEVTGRGVYVGWCELCLSGFKPETINICMSTSLKADKYLD